MKKNTPVVRNYKNEDFPEIVDVWKKVSMWKPERGDSKEVIERTIKNGGKLLVLELDGKVIGTSWLTHDHRRTYLHHFAIKPEFQGKGYSKILLEKTIESAKKMGYQLKLEVHNTNVKAKRLYEKYGFKKLDGYEVYIIRDIQTIS